MRTAQAIVAIVWIDDLVEGRAVSFSDIAKSEGKLERHIRFLAPLAFVSPRLVSPIADGSMAELKVTDLAKAAAVHSWGAQERLCGVAAAG